MGEFLGTATQDGTLGGITHNGTNAPPYVAIELKRVRSANPNSVYLTWNDSGSFQYLTDATARATGRFCILGVAKSGYQRLYVKDLSTGSVTVQSATASGDISYGTNPRFEVGDSLNARHPNADAVLCASFGHALSDAEAYQLLDNPWQILRPQKRVLYFDVAASGGATNLSPSLLTNSQVFYSPAVTPGAVSLAPSLFSNASTFHAAAVTQGGAPQELTPALLANAQIFYSPAVTAGSVTIAPALLANAQIFYSPDVTAGGVALQPGLLTNAQIFHAPTVVQEGGPQYLTPGLLTNAQTFHAATVSVGGVLVAPGLLTNAQTFYAPTVAQGFASQELAPALFGNSQTFHAPIVTPGGVVLAPEIVVNLQTFYAVVLGGADLLKLPTAISSIAAESRIYSIAAESRIKPRQTS